MENRSTPSPWKATLTGCIEDTEGVIGEAYDYCATTDKRLPMMANAKLMAAAPKMLDLLKEALPKCEGVLYARIEYLIRYIEAQRFNL